ncbi:MAG: phenylacetate-CoA oxygenase subunit PaaC [Phycisphaerae bacterium]|nr:phenylacetate-CoA oxygenase subunit PaaC [Phycisphaerae bacterium]
MSRALFQPKLADDWQTAVADLLVRLADDELVIGHRNSEWTGLAPILEADIAFSSMAQDEIGHALAYYRLLHELGYPDPDTMAFLREPQDFRCASLVSIPKGDWSVSIVRQFLYDTAETVRLEALCDSAYEPLASLARKLRTEEKYHLLHGKTWLHRLGDATDESHRRVQTALDLLWPHALGLFEPTRWDRTLANERIQPSEPTLAQEWRARVEPLLTDASLVAPEGVEPLFGGRVGRHPPSLAELIAAMQKVFRLDPGAQW